MISYLFKFTIIIIIQEKINILRLIKKIMQYIAKGKFFNTAIHVGWITWSVNKTKPPPKWQTCSTQRTTPGSMLSVPIGKYTLWNEKLPDWGNSDFSDLQGKVTYRDSKIPLSPWWLEIKQKERENSQSISSFCRVLHKTDPNYIVWLYTWTPPREMSPKPCLRRWESIEPRGRVSLSLSGNIDNLQPKRE